MNERNGSPEPVPKALARDVGEFAHDVLTLAELQAQLFVADAQECSRRALVPGLVMLCGVLLGVACFPLALITFALFLIQLFEIPYAVGFLLAVVAGAALSMLLCTIGWFQVRKRVTVLQRSQQELVHNLRWVKNVLERNRISRRI